MYTLLKAVLGYEDIESRLIDAKYNSFTDEVAVLRVVQLVNLPSCLNVHALLLRSLS